MNEKRYDLRIDSGTSVGLNDCCYTKSVSLLKITKGQARDICEQCRKIEAEAEPEPWVAMAGEKADWVIPGEGNCGTFDVLYTANGWAMLWDGTDAHACKIDELCRPAKPDWNVAVEPEERAWRPGDVILHKTTDSLWIRGPYRWTCVDEDCNSAPDQAMGTKEDVYRMNLLDILAQGPVVIGLTDGEASAICHTLNLYPHRTAACESGRRKLVDGINACRERKEQANER